MTVTHVGTSRDYEANWAAAFGKAKPKKPATAAKTAGGKKASPKKKTAKAAPKVKSAKKKTSLRKKK